MLTGKLGLRRRVGSATKAYIIFTLWILGSLKAPGSCYYALLGSPFPFRSSMKAEPIRAIPPEGRGMEKNPVGDFFSIPPPQDLKWSSPKCWKVFWQEYGQRKRPWQSGIFIGHVLVQMWSQSSHYSWLLKPYKYNCFPHLHLNWMKGAEQISEDFPFLWMHDLGCSCFWSFWLPCVSYTHMYTVPLTSERLHWDNPCLGTRIPTYCIHSKISAYAYIQRRD